MGSAMNGMALHGGILPFGGTFLIFSDYMRGSVRLAALEQARTCFVWSHDSIGLGEDGPTHQPVEHLAALRAIPSLPVIRPADANETAQCWRIHVDGDGPSAFILSRQKLPVLEGTAERAEAGVAHGAYVLVEEPGELQLVLIGTGSEVSICVEAQKTLAGQGVSARVVSMPCWELFQLLSEDEQAEVLPPEVLTLAVEAAATLGWERWADDVIGLDRFGASAPGATALEKLGFTPECVVDRARALLAKPGGTGGVPPTTAAGAAKDGPRRRTPPGFGGPTAERREQP
jgi:transketolase